MTNKVLAVPPASSEEAVAHFTARLTYETDCSDVYESTIGGAPGFVLLDVRGPASYAKAHVPGAINLPHWEISPERLSAWSDDTVFVVYCAGPHCNGADKGALKLARLGRPVKMMLGGVVGWEAEGFPFAQGTEPGSLRATIAA